MNDINRMCWVEVAFYTFLLIAYCQTHNKPAKMQLVSCIDIDKTDLSLRSQLRVTESHSTKSTLCTNIPRAEYPMFITTHCACVPHYAHITHP